MKELNTYEVTISIPVLAYRTETYRVKATSLERATGIAESIAEQSYNDDYEDSQYDTFIESDLESYSVDKSGEFKVLSVNQI